MLKLQKCMKSFIIIAMVMFLAGVFSIKAEAGVVGGNCGKSVTWSYDEEAKVLTISGSGAMENYESVSEMPWYEYKSEIHKVVVCDGVKSVGSYTFVDCESIKQVILPEGLNGIGSYAFYGCNSLENINIPNTVYVIDKLAFFECEMLSEIEVGQNVKSIETYAFTKCKKLYISVSEKNSQYTSMDGVLYDKNMTKLVAAPRAAGVFVVPSGVKQIDDGAFEYCYDLKSVVMSEGVESIGEYAFSHCESMEKINLPKGLKA